VAPLADAEAPAPIARLTATDTIVIADFTNRTGDSVFDETLRQGLVVHREVDYSAASRSRYL
jgi:hypothetical protein